MDEEQIKKNILDQYQDDIKRSEEVANRNQELEE